MLTEDHLVEAYRRKLRLDVRRVVIENHREETDAEREERMDAGAELDLLELQYTASYVFGDDDA